MCKKEHLVYKSVEVFVYLLQYMVVIGRQQYGGYEIGRTGDGAEGGAEAQAQWESHVGQVVEQQRPAELISIGRCPYEQLSQQLHAGQLPSAVRCNKPQPDNK